MRKKHHEHRKHKGHCENMENTNQKPVNTEMPKTHKNNYKVHQNMVAEHRKLKDHIKTRDRKHKNKEDISET